MTDRADAILADADNLAACARELAACDEADSEATDTHAAMACLAAAATIAREHGIAPECLADYLVDLLRVTTAIRNRDMN